MNYNRSKWSSLDSPPFPAGNADNKIAIAQAGGISPLIHLLQTGSAKGKEEAAAAIYTLAGVITGQRERRSCVSLNG